MIPFLGINFEGFGYNTDFINCQNIFNNYLPVALFIFAHQDDESGCFHEIHRLVNRGDKVWVV